MVDTLISSSNGIILLYYDLAITEDFVCLDGITLIGSCFTGLLEDDLPVLHDNHEHFLQNNQGAIAGKLCQLVCRRFSELKINFN